MCGGRRERCEASMPTSSTVVVDTAEAEEAFTCQICLDLVYKPIVQSCGHVFCFWCSRRSMNAKRQSQCPVCRRPYVHFPRVCEMLHFFFMKTLPEEYSRRARETQAMEESQKVYSPRILASPMTFKSPQKPDELYKTTLRQVERSRSVSHGEAKCQPVGITTAHDSGNLLECRMEELPCSDMENADRDPVMQPQSKAEDKTSDIPLSVEDFSCASCYKFLYRPVALNCGKVFCESCVRTADSSTSACPSCLTHHPGGAIHVCLDLHHYLETAFPLCYEERQKETELLQRTTEGLAYRITDSDQTCDAAEEIDLHETESRIVHIGAGCDGCGMFPIVGHRYHCKDCIDEHVGYDLCRTCYRGRPSLICGRFNQQHTPDHRMEEISSEFIWTGAGAPLHLNLEDGLISRRRQHQLLIDFDDYIDSFV